MERREKGKKKENRREGRRKEKRRAKVWIPMILYGLLRFSMDFGFLYGY